MPLDPEFAAAKIIAACDDYKRGAIGYITLEVLLTGYIRNPAERIQTLAECVAARSERVVRP